MCTGSTSAAGLMVALRAACCFICCSSSSSESESSGQLLVRLHRAAVGHATTATDESQFPAVRGSRRVLRCSRRRISFPQHLVRVFILFLLQVIHLASVLS